jgi:uncharacterized protein
MKSLIFPDVNVWLALTYDKHVHNQSALTWYESLDSSVALLFCRLTQMGLFRLLSTEAVMQKNTLDQQQCWQVYDSWVESGVAFLAQEPPGLDAELRTRTHERFPSPKHWADAYIASFAKAAGLTLVTFDRALAGSAEGALLLD